MQKISVWFAAARLRTLPLSVSGILVGNGVAWLEGSFSLSLFILALLTTIAFQVLSNFANDYGDGVKGTDNDQRLGPKRVLQQGLLTKAALKKGIQITAGVSLLFALSLIYLAFGSEDWGKALFFIALGLASIIAAIKYTIGDSAYGYYALGDLFVFLFFGGVSVLGSYYLQTQLLPLTLILPAASIGLFSTAVLNLNNLRDMDNDRASNKLTVPLLLGYDKGRIYHSFLVITAFVLSSIYAFLNAESVFSYLFLLLFLPLGNHLIRVSKSKGGKSLDSELKVVAVSTFIFAIVFILGFYIAH
jgi:1,4-dihydroxy-2-naphthoate octaprenyltransferase